MRVVILALAALACSACNQDPPLTGCGDLGASGCLTDGRNGYYTCSGGVRTERLCQRMDRCSLGECLPVICKPDLFSCDGQIADVCDPTGTRHKRTDCAALGSKCVVGPLTADCEVQTCTPSTTYCAPDNSEVRKCAPDGHSFDVVQVCDDPKQRGVTCAGSACRDRCTLHEAKDRSTLGCRFVTATPAMGFSGFMFANPNLDLPAEVTVRKPSGATQIITLAPGELTTLPSTIDGASGTSVAMRGLFVTASVPVYAWLPSAIGTLAIHPEHALSTRYLVGLDTNPGHGLATTAAFDNSVVTVTVVGATQAGTGVPAVAAGGMLVRTLQRGEVLTLESAGVQNGARVESTLPVAVTIGQGAHSTAVPGADTLGLDVVVPRSALLIARDAGSVTTERDGTLTLTAGQAVALTAAQRIHATQPVLVIDSNGTPVAPVEQWRSSTFMTPAVSTLVAAAPATVTGPGGSHVLALAPSGSYAVVDAQLMVPQLLTAPILFFALPGSPGGTPGAYGLAAIH